MMNKSILVIGGSLFVGRIFSIMMSKKGEDQIYVINRGRHPLNLPNVLEYQCDRHEAQALAEIIPGKTFDVIIDFCAYAPGDIDTVFHAFQGRFKQYIYISTASVYEPLDHRMKQEGDPVITPDKDDHITNYIGNKLLLEEELIDCCAKADIPYTILRPTFIYGPFNYAPRESFFIELIARKQIVPIPTNATAGFNLVYVIDITRAIECCINDVKAHDEIFNLSAPETITYNILLSEFKRLNGGAFETKEYTVEEIDRNNIPLPFPLIENELYNGEKFSKTFDFTYTSFSQGMEKTFSIFYSIYS